ncbi:response regulator transcription factor [Oceanomicrobium pacificus]|uniref:Response regulator n=1 Tax=Oceanomicrobium pacificus TaxID=2692916 RepID=A0A6B0TNQ0_9RHOB|nr:response regulator transcription factor [Oceanomicrobium pacificus]MXU66177.1 response regulator [Oceanomicrobium pacificus]
MTTDPQSDPITVLLADDHPLVAEGVRAFLDTYDHIRVVATAATGQEALDKFDAHQPAIVLMDINMPGMNGLAATEIMIEHNPQARVLILSMHDSPVYIATAKRHGARGYLLKDVPTEEIVTAIEAVHRGELYFGLAPEPDLAGKAEPLTSREQTVLLELATGKSNKEVARVLDISVRTVETHRKNIKQKLGIASTAGLTRYALEHGVLQS